MNFLAHIYLSGDNDFVKIGNFMADSIHGRKYLEYSEEFQIGILLHRHIDTFTDAHSVYRKSKHRFHEKYGHYSGVIMDIVYDHFLAKNWNSYCYEKLEVYAEDFYQLLQDNYESIPAKTQNILPYMKSQNWLVQYASLEGLETILFQMDYRTKHRVNMQEAIVEIKLFYNDLETEFTTFFEELIQFCKEKLIELA